MARSLARSWRPRGGRRRRRGRTSRPARRRRSILPHPHPHQPPFAANASSQPAPPARPHLDVRGSFGAPLRAGAPCLPGSIFQDHLLRSFYTTAVPGAIIPNSPAPLWVTPASKDPHYNLSFVTNMLNFLLTVSPGRLCVVRVRPRVFRFAVSCQNVANVLVVRGPLCMGSSVLLVHSTLASAVRAAGAVADAGEPALQAKAFKPHQPAARALTGFYSSGRKLCGS